MGKLVYLYIFTAIGLALDGIIVGILSGENLSLLLAGLLSAFSGGGLRGSFYATKQHLIGGLLAALIFMSIAYCLSLEFSVFIFGYSFTGLEWIAIGFLIGFIWTNDSIPTELRRSSKIAEGVETASAAEYSTHEAIAIVDGFYDAQEIVGSFAEVVKEMDGIESDEKLPASKAEIKNAILYVARYKKFANDLDDKVLNSLRFFYRSLANFVPQSDAVICSEVINVLNKPNTAISSDEKAESFKGMVAHFNSEYTNILSRSAKETGELLEEFNQMIDEFEKKYMAPAI